MERSTHLSGYRFASFALDLRSGDLSRNGTRIHLQEKPCSLLTALLERPGEVITRGELRERLWPGDTFVDFEDGLNTAMRKLREALNDDPQSPKFIETVRRRGYRFLATVEPLEQNGYARDTEKAEASPADKKGASSSVPTQSISLQQSGTRIANRARSFARLLKRSFLIGCLAATCGAALWIWLTRSHPVLSFSSRDPILIADFDNQTGNPRLGNTLKTALTASLEQSQYVRIFSSLEVQGALRLMKRKEDDRITLAVAQEICQRENIPALIAPGISRIGQSFVLSAQLFDPSSGALLRSYSQRAQDEDAILNAADVISADIRRDLGESRYDIHKFHRPLPQVTTASMKALENYVDGAEMFDHGRADDAVRLYQAAIAIDPGFAMAHSDLGYAYNSFYFNQPKLGEQEFRTALALSTRTTDRERSWIEVRYAESTGRVDDALDLYRSYLQHYPDDWVAQYSFAHLLRTHGHVAEAIDMYQSFIRSHPVDAGISIELATAYSELGQWPQSIQAYERAISLDPQMLFLGDVDREYGVTLLKAGQESKAEQVFSAMLANPGSFADGERSLAFLDLYHGQYASARQRLMLALARTKAAFSIARIRYMLASVEDGEGNRQAQIAQLDRILTTFDSLGPKAAYGSLLGQAYARAGAVGTAKKILTKIAPIVNERSEDEVAYIEVLKAEVASGEGDYATALQFLRPPQADDKESTAAVVCESLAHTYQQMGKFDEAAKWYLQFLNNGNSHAIGWEPQQRLFDAYYMLALDYEHSGDHNQALNMLNALLDAWKKADPNLPLLKKARLSRVQMLRPEG